MTKKTNGKVIKGLGGLYTVRLSNGEEILCRGKGVLRRDDARILVGDVVELQLGDYEKGEAVISAVLPRKNFLIRPPIANLDVLFLVAAVTSPEISYETLDKLLAITEYNQITPVLIFTKTDLEDPTEPVELYRRAGYSVFSVSSLTGDGTDAIRTYVSEHLYGARTFAFAGASGVGKSTLMNALFPDFALQTGDVSRKTERGRHTTRHVELFPIMRGVDTVGYLADTPGFSMLDFVRFDFFALEDLFACFPEFASYAGECRYKDCTHTKEKECGITRAVARGALAATRHACYCELYTILKNKKNNFS